MSGFFGAEALAGSDFGDLEPGFADPVHDAQACFRAILDALSHPGRIVRLPVSLAGTAPASLSVAAASVALTLCDIDTPVWLDEAAAAASGYLTFHCGAPAAKTPAEARFAFVGDAAVLPPLDTFAVGTDEYPERSATLVIEISRLVNSCGVLLHGPGIRDEARLGVAGVPARFWVERAALSELFPCGIDVFFVSGRNLAALPRSTRIAL
jgi:alpha-D-ribose 1-methylphosphonate 5-triphosphate synthase subunit PhnH